MLDIDTVLGWRGRPVLDRDGDKVGTLGEIYLDDATDRPAYAGVHTGLFKRRESVVPLEGAEETPDGIRLPHTAERIKDAPNVDPDVALDDDEQQRLADHFAAPAEGETVVGGGDERAAPAEGQAVAGDGDERATPAENQALPGDGEERAAPAEREAVAGDGDERAGPDAGGAGGRDTGDERDRAEVVRSEEQVSFGTRAAAPRERVRLRKHVVTEHVQKTVPVRREEVRVETDPPQEGRIVDVQDAEERD